jgi:hypothetical protein
VTNVNHRHNNGANDNVRGEIEMKYLAKCVLMFLLMAAMVAAGQNQGSAKSKGKASVGANPEPSAKAASGSSEGNKPTSPSDFGARLAQSVTADTSDDDDHVRCFFTLKQLMKLQPIPSVARLTEADQSQVLTSVVEAVDAAKENELSGAAKREFIAILAGKLDGNLVGKTPGEALATIINTLYQVQAENSAFLNAAKDPATIQQAIVEKANEHGGKAFGDTVNRQLNADKSWFKSQDPVGTLGSIAGLLQTTPGAESSAPTKAAADATAKDLTGATATDVGALVASARDAINKLAPPSDIGCAYQILSYDDSRLLFGRSVANNFISIQVTVRNLNKKEEFIVHNAMLSVDTDIHGSMGQYFEGIDKVGIEAYNNAGEALTERGIIGNSISAASTLLSTLQPIVNVDNFSNAVAAFTGGVVPGWSKLSPDHQKDQLLLIANSGFSATYTTKTVVGKSGAATFYTWFPAKPFLQGWWVQDCAKNVVTVRDSDDSGGSEPPPQLGPDLKRARNACLGVKAADWKTKHYKDWSSIAEQLFRDLSLTVVAGIHVQEEGKNKSSTTNLNCPKNKQGQLDISQASSDGSLICDVTGDNLDKVAKFRLENSANAVDPIRPEATVTVNGDNTTAKAVFKVSDLASATGEKYSVFAVGKDGSETATGLPPVYLDSNTITLTGVTPASINLGSLPDQINLTGYNLNNLSKVCLKNDSAGKPQTVDVKKGATKTKATVDANSLKVLKLSAGDWEIYLNDCSDSNDSKLKLIITGSAQPQISSFNPASASPGKSVTIDGSNFTGLTSVTFGSVPVQSPRVTDNRVVVTVPTGAKSGPIEVTTPGGSAKTSTTFTVLATPKPARPKSPAATPK